MADPKPSELIMSRVNFAERLRKARTRDCGNSLGRDVIRGDMPIELGDSWFSPKYI